MSDNDIIFGDAWNYERVIFLKKKYLQDNIRNVVAYIEDITPLEFENLKIQYEDKDFLKFLNKVEKRAKAFNYIDKVKKTFIERIGNFYDHTDLSEQFIQKYPIFYSKEKIFFIWDNIKYKWVMIDEIDVMNIIDVALDNKYNTLAAKNKNEIIEALKRAGRKKKPKPVNPYWVQIKNKVYDINTDKVFIATPEYFFTNPIIYSVGKNGDTPVLDSLFKAWVVKDDIGQDITYIDTLYEYIAYCLLANSSFMQRMITLTGSGSNGKGTFIKIIEKFIDNGDGDNFCSSDFERLSKNRFEAANLYKKSICLIDEVNADDLKNTKLLKKLTGEDNITYEYKNKIAFSERSNTKIIVSTNSLPTTPDRTMGYYRRWLIIDFPYTFNEITDVLSRIPDIEYNNLVFKCLKILKKLIVTKKFTNEGSFEERKKRYEDRSNPLGKFIKEFCTIKNNAETPFFEFYDIYSDFLKQQGQREFSKPKVSKELRSMGFEIEKVKRIIKDKNQTWVIVFGLSLIKKLPKLPKLPKFHIVPYPKTLSQNTVITVTSVTKPNINESLDFIFLDKKVVTYNDLREYLIDNDIKTITNEGLISEYKKDKFIRV